MKPYVMNGKVYVSVNNIEEFKELVDKANEQAKQLNDTINKINNFDLEVEFGFGKTEEKTATPKTCGKCAFYSEAPYSCHNERGYEAKCGMGYMNEDMRDKSFRNKMYPGCKLDQTK